MRKGSFLGRFLQGMRAGVPVVLGYIPVGIAYGVMARQAGFTAAQTCGMSLLVYAGASQMMAVGMYAQGASIIAMITATFILNLRHVIMSTCVNNSMKKAGRGIRLFAAFGITDESFAIFTANGGKKGTAAFFLGLSIVNYASWNVGSCIGAFASDIFPPIVTAALGISLYAMFLGLLLPGIRGNLRLILLVVITAALNTILSQFIPSSWSLIISTLVCAAAGVFFVDLDDEKGGRR